MGHRAQRREGRAGVLLAGVGERDPRCAAQRMARVRKDGIVRRARRRRRGVDARGDEKNKTKKNENENEKHPFFAVYFEEPDASGHKHGPHAEETKAAARLVDDAMRRLRLAVGDDAWNEINVIVVSDHGMAELAPSRAVFLADEPCAVPFRDVHVEGSDVVMHVWPRLLRISDSANETTRHHANGDGDAKSTPADPADPRADPRFDAESSRRARIRACHPNVSAWTRDAVPSRFAYGGNRRVGPVVIAADVGWTLCGANASANADQASGETGEYAHERDWSAEHSARAWLRFAPPRGTAARTASTTTRRRCARCSSRAGRRSERTARGFRSMGGMGATATR